MCTCGCLSAVAGEARGSLCLWCQKQKRQEHVHTVHGCACRCPQFPRELQGGLDNEWNKNDGSQVSEVHKFTQIQESSEVLRLTTGDTVGAV